jgi:NTP pyrophosphatase (non-canonical NTP hydrolase)
LIARQGDQAGAAQERVRETIGRLGGYWRPLAGVARLLEELGELADEDLRASEPAQQLSAELADLWIITTALADQFLADVSEPGIAANAGQPSLTRLIAAAGHIARVANYYDGPKLPRDARQLPSLESAVAGFHRELSLYARTRGIDLNTAVHDKLSVIAIGDSGRFAHTYNDPSTEPCIDEFRALGIGPPGWDPAKARLWGARASSSISAEICAARLTGSLRAFARAAPRERLDGYVIRGPDAPAVDASGNWRRLLDSLSAHDPAPRPCLAEGSFSFEGLAMAADGFFPPFPEGASGPRPMCAFGLLRPTPEAAG